MLLCDKKANIVAVDASGFQTNQTSYYYANGRNRQDKRKYRRYLKLTIAIDTNTQYVMANKIRFNPRHDTIDFPFVLRDLKCDYVVADRGYDSKKNRRFVLRQMKVFRRFHIEIFSQFIGSKVKLNWNFIRRFIIKGQKLNVCFL
jgi:hypothetical protein